MQIFPRNSKRTCPRSHTSGRQVLESTPYWVSPSLTASPRSAAATRTNMPFFKLSLLFLALRFRYLYILWFILSLYSVVSFWCHCWVLPNGMFFPQLVLYILKQIQLCWTCCWKCFPPLLSCSGLETLPVWWSVMPVEGTTPLRGMLWSSAQVEWRRPYNWEVLGIYCWSLAVPLSWGIRKYVSLLALRLALA